MQPGEHNLVKSSLKLKQVTVDIGRSYSTHFGDVPTGTGLFIDEEAALLRMIKNHFQRFKTELNFTISSLQGVTVRGFEGADTTGALRLWNMTGNNMSD